MSQLSNKEIRKTDRFVIKQTDDATDMLVNLKVPALALKGEEDYVPTPPNNIPFAIVKGGHISPLQAPISVSELVHSVIELSEEGDELGRK